jgi:hypothetical protein
VVPEVLIDGGSLSPLVADFTFKVLLTTMGEPYSPSLEAEEITEMYEFEQLENPEFWLEAARVHAKYTGTDLICPFCFGAFDWTHDEERDDIDYGDEEDFVVGLNLQLVDSLPPE